ncbi:reverse transcriptase family protein [Flavobacterium sp. '19STA2R22 D10 B1']|uniref:reverse transcriptase family protein n=1 Tax=Flavobacterium aerium TaxID=3037261 RepID=UPI00278C34FD|nr:reverse transcriptase family protein [Flavobacterium sp. '19STA2R22 D10 B1']
MKTRIKDLAYCLKVDKNILIQLTTDLDIDESKFYNNWDEPKTDERGLPRFDDNGIALTRPINAPIKRLKIVQSLLLHNVLYKSKLPNYFFGGLKNKDAVMNGRHHQGNKFFFLTDLKDFYPSVSSSSVEKALRKEGFYPDVARLITRICTKEGAIPQGCPTSSYLAALVVYHSCDNIFQKYISEGFKVSVYVDDITISNSIDFKLRTPKILDELRERGLKINFAKTHYCTKTPKVTGVLIKNNGILPLPHTFASAVDPNKTENSRKGHMERIKYVKKISKQKISRHNKNSDLHPLSEEFL